jgi:phosphate transport system permease protein
MQAGLIELVKFIFGIACTIAIALTIAWALDALKLDPRGTFVGTYVQRNALIVGFAMGFAIVPIIFSISEEALSNVPRHLIAGSLALGATRWQTLVKLVLVSASPGIFSAMMIGFGRAIGETMIVLMATGNTPIMDWSLFNGFRTLSANIAVEIPEAPHGGTLYRILFLAALLLFIFTFLINTVAEIIRRPVQAAQRADAKCL